MDQSEFSESMPLKDCPFCGSDYLEPIRKTNLIRFVNKGLDGLWSNQAVSETAGVRRQHVTDLQHFDTDVSGRMKESADAIARAFGVPTEELIAFDPFASEVLCHACGARTPWVVWNRRVQDDATGQAKTPNE